MDKTAKRFRLLPISTVLPKKHRQKGRE